VGNPLRAEFLRQATPAERFAGRSGPLRLLVVGGSLGAKALNDTVPQALALLPEHERPVVVHQSGEKQIEALKANYAAAGVQAELTPFIDDTAAAFAHADLIVCRAGASTVTEISAVGAAALFVPFPHAVDDHQTTNARFLVEAGGAWLVPQTELTAQSLAERLRSVNRAQLLEMAIKAKQMEKTQAVAAVVVACEQLAKVKAS
jgi:UDP-N-acetylglucosamine--N-acetylmuramyl-(pentapeptide) pyrophosphoryl-undecaprenol N-acetylglucosamine transferase